MLSAEHIVRDLAKKHGQRAVLKRLGNFKTKLIANAKASFAPRMTNEETPLILYDRSFLMNGKAGVLLTDRAIYSSKPTGCIPLESIRSIHVEAATMSQKMAGNNDVHLIVNGQTFFSQVASLGSNSSFLSFIAEVTDALRKGLTDPSPAIHATGTREPETTTDSGHATQDPIQLAAGAICAGHSKDQIIQDLQAFGTQPSEAERVVDGMLAIFNAPRSGALAQRTIGGVALAVIGLLSAVAIEVNHGSALLGFAAKGMAVAGVVLFFSGMYRLIFGAPKLTALELANTWRSQGT